MKLSELRRGPSSLDGVWWDFERYERIAEPHPTRFCVRIAEANNPKFRDGLAALRIKYASQLQGDDDKRTEAAKHMMAEAVGRYVVTDWRNLDDAEYSPEKAAEFLLSKDYWAFTTFVQDVSNQPQHYRAQEAQSVAGN